MFNKSYIQQIMYSTIFLRYPLSNVSTLRHVLSVGSSVRCMNLTIPKRTGTFPGNTSYHAIAVEFQECWEASPIEYPSSPVVTRRHPSSPVVGAGYPSSAVVTRRPFVDRNPPALAEGARCSVCLLTETPGSAAWAHFSQSAS